MRVLLNILCFLLLLHSPCPGQQQALQIKVFDFDEGLSHRNVFKILQDEQGFIWVATINGLNRFDGYQFEQYNSHQAQNRIPFDVISDMALDASGRLWLASPDYLTAIRLSDHQTDTLRIKNGPIIRRESWIPHNLLLDDRQSIWMATYKEQLGQTHLQRVDADGHISDLFQVEGKYTRRPLLYWEGAYYMGNHENELLTFNQEGTIIDQFAFPVVNGDPANTRIVQLSIFGDQLWALLRNGQLYYREAGQDAFVLHPASERLKHTGLKQSFWVEENGDMWIGGNGNLWYYNADFDELQDIDKEIRELTKNNCTYRQIVKDRSGVIWVASDFGAIKIGKVNDVFTKYMHGGSEYCNNVYCSTRGMTEDEEGMIYVSHYSSMHKINPQTQEVTLLFPDNDYYNYPFGIVYDKGALYTGNGKRIDLQTLQVDTLFSTPDTDKGVVAKDAFGKLWFGFEQLLYTYDPSNRALTSYHGVQGIWQTTDGSITYILPARDPNYLYIGTNEKGVYKIHRDGQRLAHYYSQAVDGVQLQNDRINALYEDVKGQLWVATAKGLYKINADGTKKVHYTLQQGLPNDFINGILPEGDSCLWISTDNGLCRLSIASGKLSNYFIKDGLSANEFNRISFYKAKDGTLYFGGLNGINAFHPDNRSFQNRVQQKQSKVLFTSFRKYDGEKDTVLKLSGGLSTGEKITLSYWDRFFTFQFALSDYQSPQENVFSYRLDGYEEEWSPRTSLNEVRYNNIPAGDYTFRVRAAVGKGEWNSDELQVQVKVMEAYYNTWWFWALCGFLLLSVIYGIMRYRIYRLAAREKELERLVKARTNELELEKKKSEDLLLNILPFDTAEELKKFGFAKAKRHDLVTVMFTDFKGFSKISVAMEPEDLVAEIDFCFRAFDEIIDRYQLEKIKTIGDAYLCVGGISSSADESDATKVISAAMEIQAFMKAIAIEKELHQEPYFETRIGIHTGPVVAGIVGIKKFAYDIWGETVNIASRMETNGAVGKVNISDTTFELIKDTFECSHQGNFSENGGEEIGMYFVDAVKEV